jgi:Sec-independent protein translocase protein TatA
MDIPVIIGLIGLGITLLTNIGALVWGASRMASTLAVLTSSVQELKEAVGELEKFLNNLNKRVSILEAQNEWEEQHRA